MKRFSFKIIFAAFVASAFISCRQGDQGEPGPAGASAQLLPYKEGSITGTLSGTSKLDDESFTQNLKFQYYKTPEDNVHSYILGEGTENRYIITRYDSTGESYIKFNFAVDSYDPQQQTAKLVTYIYDPSVTIVTNKKTNNSNTVFYFASITNSNNPFEPGAISLSSENNGENSYATFDNISIDGTTGLISFDYTIVLSYYQNTTYSNATLEGSVSVTPYEVKYRQAASK